MRVDNLISFPLAAIFTKDDSVLSDIPVQLENEFALNLFLANKTEKLFVSIWLAPLDFNFHIRSLFERESIISKQI
ncbi:hypothetical protein [Lactococcus petauri]|uniref:hypothetical protein n=1 Tax=Lactococcus petauri TaxID=1940789 RepID=UPI00254FB20C|nr:hypothetical protein [Lactococcus petauri]